MSKSSAGSGFLRLKFKPINKTTKPNVKSSESAKKRKRDKQLVGGTIDDSSYTGSANLEVNLKKVTKPDQLRIKEPKREACKLLSLIHISEPTRPY